jgi:catalase-peroxidase
MEEIQRSFNERQRRHSSQKTVSFADLVILGGNTAIEEAARRAGYSNVRIPFVPGRTDALQSKTDVTSFNALKPTVDGFRNYEESSARQPETSLVDRAHLLTLATPEMVALLGGLRVLNANSDNSLVGVLTERPGLLTNDFFINLLDDGTVWSPVGADGRLFTGSRAVGAPWTASRVDLVLGSNSQLRAISEAYASADSASHFLRDFVNAWTKVTMLDRFDLLRGPHGQDALTFPSSKL